MADDFWEGENFEDAPGTGKPYAAGPGSPDGMLNAAIESDGGYSGAERDTVASKAGNPQAVDPLGDLVKGSAAYLKYLGAAADIGTNQVIRGYEGAHALVDESYYEKALANSDEKRIAQLQASQIDPIEKTLHPADIRRLFKEGVQTLPYMMNTVGGGLAGSGVSALIGAGQGALTGPAAPEMMPVGAALGAMSGFKPGMFLTSSTTMAGDTYLTLRQKKIPHGPARNYAIGAGALMGIIESTELGLIFKLGKEAAKTYIRSPGFKATVKNAIGTMAKTMVAEVGEETLQEMVSIATETLAGMTENVGSAIPTRQEMLKRIGDAAVTAAQASVGLGLIPHAAGISTAAARSGKNVVKSSQADIPTSMTQLKTLMDTAVAEQNKPLNKSFDTGIQLDVKAEVAPESKRTPQEKIEIAESKRKDADAEITRLEEEIDELESQFDQASDEDKPAIEAQLLQAQLEMRKARRDYRTAVKQKKAGRFEFAKEQVNNIIAAANSRFVIEQDESPREQITRLQGIVKELVQQSELTAAQKSQFISSITQVKTAQAGVKTPASILNSGPDIIRRITKMMEKNDRDSARKQLDAVLKKTAVRTKNKRKASRVDAVRQARLDLYAKYIGDQKAAQDAANNAIQQEIDEEKKIEEALAKGDLSIRPPKLTTGADKVAIANRVLGVEEFDAQQLLDLAEDIENIYAGGRDEMLDRKEAETQRLFGERDTVSSAIDGVKPASDKDAIDNAVNFFKKLKRTFGDKLSTWNAITGMMFQHERNPEKALNILDVSKEENREGVMLREALNKAVDFMTGGNAKKMNAVMNRIAFGNKTEDIGNHVARPGEPHKPLVISRNQAIGLYMRKQDSRPQVIEGLRNSGFTYKSDVEQGEISTEELIDRYLSDEDKQVAEGMLKFYEWFWPQVNNHYVKEYGTELKHVDKYTGHVRRDVPVRGGSLFKMNVHDAQSIIPSPTIETTNTTAPLVWTNPFSDLWNHAAEFVHWMAWSEKERQLSFILGDPALKKKIEQKYGKGFKNTVDVTYQHLVGTRAQQNAGRIKMLDDLRARLASSKLYGKFLSAPKQWTALLTFMDRIGPAQLAAGIANGMSNINAVKAMLDKSDFYANRADSMFLELKDAADSDEWKAYVKSPARGFIKLNSLPLEKWGDRPTVALGMYAVYKAKLAEGMSDADALHEAEKAANETQSSATPSQLTYGERQWGSLGRFLFLFARQNVQVAGSELNAIRRGISLGGKERTKALKKILAFHTAQALFQLVASSPTLLFGDDDDREEQYYKVARAALLGPFIGMPVLVGAALDGLVTRIQDVLYDRKTRQWGFEFEPYKQAKLMFDFWTKDLPEFAEKINEGEDISAADVLKFMDKGAGVVSGATGLPIEPWVKKLQDYEKTTNRENQ